MRSTIGLHQCTNCLDRRRRKRFFCTSEDKSSSSLAHTPRSLS
uniref:Uncharacterized protein n=1 Tax=Triticum urartu TaxID=4572 RepID=A0A8R7TBN6_TRIUA